MPQPNCPDCQRRMEGGFMVSGGPNELQISGAEWVEGVPRTTWTGLQLKGRRRLAVYAWRCPGCTQVRLFAPEG